MSEVTKPNGRRWDWLSIVTEATNRDRTAIMEAGTAPAFESLAGYEFAGANTLPLTRLIGIRKFKKGFYDGPHRVPADRGPTEFIQGYNCVVEQNGVPDAHLPKPSFEKPKRHGFYRVHHVVKGAKYARYENALLLDYSLGGNPWYDPSSLLRDYLVQVYPDDPDLLLGHAYANVLGAKVPLSFFVLRRENAHEFTGA